MCVCVCVCVTSPVGLCYGVDTSAVSDREYLR